MKNRKRREQEGGRDWRRKEEAPLFCRPRALLCLRKVGLLGLLSGIFPGRIGNKLSWPSCSLGGTRRLHMPSGSRMGGRSCSPSRAVAMEKPLSLSCVYQSPLPPHPQAAWLQPVGACLPPQEGQGRSWRQRPQAGGQPGSGHRHLRRRA